MEVYLVSELGEQRLGHVDDCFDAEGSIPFYPMINDIVGHLLDSTEDSIDCRIELR